MTTLYKVLNEDGTPCHGGRGKWDLPNGRRPGKWMPKITNISLCSRGYHVVTAKQLIGWLGPAIFTVEVRGDHEQDDEKSVWSEARLLTRVTTWDERTARLFAADCAERVLPIYGKAYPTDDRPHKAIEAARQYARGEISDAARDAARDAAGDAAGDAARAAARAAARDAAGDAARAAARDAARDAAQDAAWAAARDAARDAARAAAGAAARDAAWAAERLWQCNLLAKYLSGKIA